MEWVLWFGLILPGAIMLYRAIRERYLIKARHLEQELQNFQIETKVQPPSEPSEEVPLYTPVVDWNSFILRKAELMDEAKRWLAMLERRRDPRSISAADNRAREILYESVKIVLNSKSPGTMESRINLIEEKVFYLFGTFDGWEVKLRVLWTHYYLAQIEALVAKAAGYKTEKARQNALDKVFTIFEQAAENPNIYPEVMASYLQERFDCHDDGSFSIRGRDKTPV